VTYGPSGVENDTSKIQLPEDQVEFSAVIKSMIKKQKSMIREALKLLRKECEAQKLRQSADLYAEIYDEDSELREMTDVAVNGWPE
jgi:hypothetical protein